jgi:hypothetical protein
MKTNQSRASILKEFEDSPDSALFPQEIPAAVIGCSEALLERNRWLGTGIPFIKIGRAIRYRKSEILQWINQHHTISSTSDAA